MPDRRGHQPLIRAQQGMRRPPDRRTLLLALLGAAAIAGRPLRSLAQAAAPDAPPPRREQLLAEAEATLARGDTDAALRLFERAASMRHAADSELGLVRTYMQLGQYRRAVAFAAHTAGAHRGEPGAVAFYAWLLFLGGQVPAADRLLGDAASATDAVTAFVRTALRTESPGPNADGTALPVRLAPYGPLPGLPRDVRVVASGTLFDTGRSVIVPSREVPRTAAVWVRNGLGQGSRGRITRRIPALGVAIADLAEPLPLPEGLAFAPRDPFPGSIGYAVGYAATGTQAAWPLLRGGFVGRPEQDPSVRALGIELPAGGGRGGPVFSADGLVAGVAVRSAAGGDRLLLPSQLAAAGIAHGTRSAPDPGDHEPAWRPSTDEIYERAMRVAVQVLAGA